MQHNLRFSTRTWLLWFSLLVTLPVLIFLVGLIFEYQAFKRETVIHQLETQTDKLAQALNQQLETTTGVLISMTESDAAKHMDLPSLYAQSKRITQRMPHIRAITLVDRRHILFLSSIPIGSADFPVNAPEQIEQALSTHRANVSGPFHAPTTGRMVVAITVPIVDRDGSCSHALRAIVTTDFINQFIMASKISPDWTLAVTDSRGTIVARNRNPERFVGQKAHASLVDAIRSNTSQVFYATTLEGTKTVSRVQPIFGGNWYLGVGVPEVVLQAPVYTMVLHITLLALSWAGLSVLIAALFSNYLVRQMRTATNAMSREEWRQPLSKKLRIGELLQMFDQFREAKRTEESVRTDLGITRLQRDDYQDLYDSAPCGYHSLDRTGKILRINRTELSWLGRKLNEVIGRNITEFFSPASVQTFRESFPKFLRDGYIQDVEAELIRIDGSVMPVLLSATAIRDEAGAVLASRTTIFDNTAQKMYEAELQRLARIDPLTSVSNRRSFYETAQSEIVRSRRLSNVFSVMMIDIDHFKKINDDYGHAAGDEVLKQMCNHFPHILREVDKPARMGGEEFAVLMPETSIDDARRVAERLRQKIHDTPIELDAHRQIHITISIGLTQWAADEEGIGDALKRADTGLYRAKNNGRNQVCDCLKLHSS